MNTLIKKSYSWSLFAGIIILIAGCGITNSNKSGTRPVNVYMQTNATGTAYSNPYGLSEVPHSASVDSTLKLTDVSLFVKELRLKSVTEDSLDFHQQDLVVSLPLGQDSIQISTTAVPKGSYDGLSLHIGKPSYADSSKYPNFVDGPSEHSRYSIIISGTYNGSAFTFKTHHEFEFHLKIDPPLAITDSTVSADVNLIVNTSNWFVDKENGQTLDPNNPEDAEQIIENIEASLEAHKREHEKEDDHHENNNGSHGNDGGD